jgi:HSP20 family molecular chaperone IbpA
MKLVKVNPAYRFNAIDRLLNDFFVDGFNYDRFERKEIGFQPATNVYEFEDSVKVELQIPGFSKEQVKITLDKDILVVAGEPGKTEKDDVKYSRIQFENRNFEKRFKLNNDIDQENIQAVFENGVLRLTFLKKKEAKQITRNIEIA